MHAASVIDLSKLICRGTPKGIDNASEDAVDLINKMLDRKTESRLTAEEVLGIHIAYI